MKTTYMEQVLANLEREPTKRVVVLLSGGIESMASCILLRNMDYEVVGLFVDYGQPNVEAERLIVQRAYKQNLVNFLEEVKLSMFTIGEAKTDKQGWVPARNSIFMTIAGAYAERHDADAISIGVMKQDLGVFGDNDPTHHHIMSALLSHSLGRGMDVLCPTLHYDKKALIRMCKSYGVLTVSCWNAKVVVLEKEVGDGDFPQVDIEVCGECAQCLELEECSK